MGNTNQQIQNQLQFVQTLQDHNFGETQIYKTNEGVYIMKLDRNHVKGDLAQTTFQKITQYVLQKSPKYIIPIVHTLSHQQNGLCLVYERTSIFTEYYNHTLADMLRNKKVFEEPELWYILENMLKMIVELKEHQLGIELELGNVFLTLKGSPCVSHYHLYSTTNTIACCQPDMHQLLAKMIIELVLGRPLPHPEEIQESREIIESLGKVCSRHKTLGRVVKELLRREKNEKELLEDIEDLQFEGKIKMAHEIQLTKYRYIIPENVTQKQQRADPLSSGTEKPKEQCSRSSQIASTLKKGKERRPTEEPQSVSTKQKRKGSSTASKKEKERVQGGVLSDFLGSHNILTSKEESSKILLELEKRKQEYQVQMERFRMKKQQLLCQSEKENLEASRPVFRDTEEKKNKNRPQEHIKKKKTDKGNHPYQPRLR